MSKDHKFTSKDGSDSEYVDGVELDYILSDNTPYLAQKIKIAPKNTPMFINIPHIIDK